MIRRNVRVCNSATRLSASTGSALTVPVFDVMMFDFKVLRPRATMNLVVQTGSEAPHNVHLEARLKKEANLLGTQTREGDFWNEITESENYADEHQYHTSVYANGQIGYAQILEFGGESDEFLKGVLEHGAGSKAMIVDLRSNPGGSVETLKKVMGCFEQSQVTVLNEVSRKKSEPWIVKPQKPNFAMPMFILIDSRTGSAAEIFARHFQRTGKAVVVGDHSPGRVTVSRVFDGLMGSQDAIPFSSSIGVARAVFPDGEELERKGVTPDVMCIPSGEDMQTQNDVCLDKALALARAKVDIKPAPQIEIRTMTGK